MAPGEATVEQSGLEGSHPVEGIHVLLGKDPMLARVEV